MIGWLLGFVRFPGLHELLVGAGELFEFERGFERISLHVIDGLERFELVLL